MGWVLLGQVDGSGQGAEHVVQSSRRVRSELDRRLARARVLILEESGLMFLGGVLPLGDVDVRHRVALVPGTRGELASARRSACRP